MSTETEETEKKGVPGWGMQPFNDFIDYVEELGQLVYLSIRGISFMTKSPELVNLLAVIENSKEVEEQERLMELAKREAQLAKDEVKNGFPLLHAQAVVSLWGGLETLIKFFLSKWLAMEPKAMLVSQVQKLKVRVSEYESLDNEERCSYILDLLEREVKAPLKHGVTRFEVLLNVFGLGGNVKKEIRKNLYEIYQVRNVIVHRRSTVDTRFIKACPWLKYSIGDQLTISHESFQRYNQAVMSYAALIMIRVGSYFGKSLDEVYAHLKKTSFESFKRINEALQ